MKIVYIATSAIPSRTANSIHVMKMCQAFAHNGHMVTLIVPDKKDEAEQQTNKNIFEYYGIDKIFDVMYVPWLKVKGRGYIFGFLAAKAVKRLKLDLIYCRSITGCFFSINKNSKVIFESHAPSDKNSMLEKYLFKKIIQYNNFQKLVVITKALKDYYEEYYPFIKDRIYIAPDGADPVPDNIVPVTLPNTGKRLQVGYIGQLYKGKGMEVISRLAPLCPWADFHIVGGLKKDIDFWKAECKAIDNLVFHGYIPYNATGSYMLAFDVLLLPNQEEVIVGKKYNIGSWTSPIKAFEYMSAKKPILASDLPVLREVFTNDINALLAPPENIELWAENLKRIQNDHECAKRIANQAHNEFIEKYTWSIRARKIVENAMHP